MNSLNGLDHPTDGGRMSELNMQRKAIRFLRLPEVIEISGLSRSSIYERIKEGLFPANVSLGGRTVGWVEEEVLQWASDRVAESRPESEQLPVAA